MTSKSTTPYDGQKFLFIISLHRSGSTFLLSMFGTDSEHYYAVPEELNLEEHFFFKNTIARKIRAGVRLSFDDRKAIHGSYWQNIERYHEDPQQVLDTLNRLSQFSYRGVIDAILVDKEVGERTAVIKYPSNVFFLKSVMEEFPKAKFCFLVRDIESVLISKINDEQMRALRERSRLKYLIRRLSILCIFSFDHMHLSRWEKRLRNRENIIAVKYEDINTNRNLLKTIDLISGDTDLFDNVCGKRSSLVGKVSKLCMLERVFLTCLK